MKKLTAFFVSIVMLLSLVTLASCGGESTACKHEHTEEIVTSATCTVDGSTIVKCKDCGAVVNKTTTPKLGHEYVAGFCTHKGCKDPIDHDNDRFYANLLCSVVDTTKYVYENDGTITLTSGENVYEYDTVKILSGEAESKTANETDGDRMFSFEAKGSANVDLRLVYDSENLKIAGLKDGEETLFVRANAEAVKKVLDFYKDDIIGAISGSAGSGSGMGGIGGSTGGSTGGMDVKTYLETIYDAIKTKDGTDATVKSINTGIHNIIASVSAITATENGYQITPDKAKIKEFNHSVDVQTFENFVNNMFGDKTFTNVATVIKLAVNSDPDLTDEEKTTKYNDILNDCKTLSIYDIIEKNYKENNPESENTPESEPLDIEKTINEFVDNTEGLSIKFFTDKKGNLLSGEIVADNFELFGDITIPITIGGVTNNIVINGYTLNGKFNVSFLKEYIGGDEYKPFGDLKNTADTTLAAGTHKGSPTAGNCVDFSFETDENGDIVSATSIFKLNENPDTGEAEYYKVVCSDPIAVVRKVEDGKVTYTLNNFITADEFTVNLNTKVYKVDKDGNNAVEVTDQDTLDRIVSDIDEIEFSILAPIG